MSKHPNSIKRNWSKRWGKKHQIKCVKNDNGPIGFVVMIISFRDLFYPWKMPKKNKQKINIFVHSLFFSQQYRDYYTKYFFFISSLFTVVISFLKWLNALDLIYISTLVFLCIFSSAFVSYVIFCCIFLFTCMCVCVFEHL